MKSSLRELSQLFNIFKFIAPLLCLALSMMDFVKAVASQDKDALSKATKTTGKRIIFAMILFREDGRGLHDIIAKTKVISTEEKFEEIAVIKEEIEKESAIETTKEDNKEILVDF